MNEHLKHMDVGSRNARLCATLQGMGLFVLPVFAADDPERIDYMQVSAELPAIIQQAAKNATGLAVALPVTRADVAEHVRPTQPKGGSVIDFPSMLAERTIVAPADHATVAVDPVVRMSCDLSGA